LKKVLVFVEIFNAVSKCWLVELRAPRCTLAQDEEGYQAIGVSNTVVAENFSNRI